MVKKLHLFKSKYSISNIVCIYTKKGYRINVHIYTMSWALLNMLMCRCAKKMIISRIIFVVILSELIINVY